MSFVRSASLPFFLALAAFLTPLPAFAEDWLPVSPEELKMTSEPNAPGAPAIFLYRQVDRDDQNSHEYYYARIKILTEEGRKYADVEIPYLKGESDIHKLEARTIRPDGTVINFGGKMFDKTIVKAGGQKIMAKTFTLPEVLPGTIIEYRYSQDIDAYYVSDVQWILSADLFTKRAKFSLKRYFEIPLAWSWPLGLPPGTDPPKDDHNLISLETHDVPAFQAEDFMPPEDEMKYRVEFVYSRNLEKDPTKFWTEEGKREYRSVQDFTNKRGAMEKAVSEIVSASDSSEVKLRKIYARTQQIRNFTFEREKSEQELNRENLKEINNVEDVWKRGYGDGNYITWLFLGLARAAGFDAYPVEAATRNRRFFKQQLMDASDLNNNLVLVKLDGKDLYFDPGTAFAPYGLLPWHETAVQGLRLDKDGGSWVQIPVTDSSQSRVERKAALKLTDDGNLEGKLTVTFSGLYALRWRLDEVYEDAASREKSLEDEVKNSIPQAAEVKLTNQPDWKSSSPTLVAEYDIKVPGWATSAGRRQLIPVGLFSASEKHMFEHADRAFPVYFSFPFEIQDDVTLDLPAGLQVSSLPPAQDIGGKVVHYTLAADGKNSNLHWTRHVVVDIVFMEAKYYTGLQSFYQKVRTGDEEQIVLMPN